MLKRSGNAYSGKNSYKLMDDFLLSKGRSLMIISPYISEYYINKLLKESKKSRIYIITSNKNEGVHAKKYYHLPIMGYIKLLASALVVGAVSLFFGYYVLSLLIIQMIILITIPYAIIFVKILFSRDQKMEIRISKAFIHEKIYIAEKSAITGSANLTYSGMHKNIEHIEAITDKKRIAELRAHFNSLWKNIKD